MSLSARDLAGYCTLHDPWCSDAGPHTDWGALTILATDNEPGLQICLGKTWIDVEPRAGMFVVNLGDMVDRSAAHLSLGLPGLQSLLRESKPS